MSGNALCVNKRSYSSLNMHAFISSAVWHIVPSDVDGYILKHLRNLVSYFSTASMK